MPEDIALRIDQALSTEALNATGFGDVSRETSRTPQVSPELSASAVRPLNRARPLGSTAVAPHRTSPRPGERPGDSPGPGRPGRRRRRAVLGTAFAAAVLGMSGYFLQAMESGDMKADSSADRSLGAAEQDTGKAADTFSGRPLQDRVSALLSASSAPAGENPLPSAKDFSPNAASPGNTLRAPAVSVPACVRLATGRTTPAAAVEEGVYRGQDAFLVVLPHAGDPSLVTAYVVGASCVTDAPRGTGVLLFTHVYPRP
ncbi:hypothetical protein [uncultured Streptomyces sp.]|uniref:hypothetical protein n=1 Tax=uncultured Streptomyces sp. TaxID=174707 RepID=UPI0026055BEC|nr:hypothetical protein [uncultured Streptomyces sp.]